MGQPDTCIVCITDAEGNTLGTGFLLSHGGRIATCHHVVEGTKPCVAFPANKPLPAQVVAADPIHDVVILQLAGELPLGAEPARLGRSAEGHYSEFRTRGYRRVDEMQGIPAEGRVLGSVSECPGIRYLPLMLKSQDIRKGMSGAPVYIPDLDLVVGMITSYWDALAANTGYSDRDTAFAIPADALSALCPEILLENPLDDYRHHVLKETRWVHLTGMPLRRDREGQTIPLEVPLDRVYICVQAMPEVQRREERESEHRKVEESAEHTELLSLGEGHETSPPPPHRPSSTDVPAVLRSLGEYLYRRGEVYRAEGRPEPVEPDAALKEKGRLVILGAPGSGKTTALRYLARQAARDADGPLPILVSMRDYATYRGSGGPPDLRAFALNHVCRGNATWSRLLEMAVEAGQVLWLVDAMDEARGWAADAAKEISTLPGCLLVTSRPLGYERTGLQELPHFEILPLASPKTDKFIRDWFDLLAERQGKGKDWIEARVAWLQKQVIDIPHMTPLIRNPLLLTFLVVLAADEPEQDLPAHRAGLYQRYLDELLATWEVQKLPKEGFEGRPVLRLGPLQGKDAQDVALIGFIRLGWRLHLTYYGGRVGALPIREHLVEDLAQDLQLSWDLGLRESRTLARSVLGFWEEAGVIDRWRLRGKEYLAFRHLTFQEYAAGKYLAQAWNKVRNQTWRFLKPRLHHPYWREPILLMAGLLSKAEASVLLQRVLRADSPYERQLHRDLLLAGMIIGEGIAVHEELKEKVAQALVHMVWRSEWREEAAQVLTSLGMWAVDPLAKVMERQKRWMQTTKTAARRFGGVGRSLVQLLWWLSDRQGQWERLEAMAAAATALSRIGDEHATTLVLSIVDMALSGDERIPIPPLETIVRALGRIGGERAVDCLLGLLDHPEDLIRRAAVEALGHTRNRRAVGPLLEMLQAAPVMVEPPPGFAGPRTNRETKIDTPVRGRELGALVPIAEANEALAFIGEHAADRLLSLLGDEQVGYRAGQALGLMGSEVAGSLVKMLSDERARTHARDALIRIGLPAMEYLIPALLSENPPVRKAAIRALRSMSLGIHLPVSMVEPVLQVLDDEDLDVRSDAEWVLTKVRDRRAVEPLLAAMGTEASHVRRAAARALGKVGGVRAAEALVRALSDQEEEVRWVAAEALVVMGEDVVGQMLQQAIEGQSLPLRLMTAWVSGRSFAAYGAKWLERSWTAEMGIRLQAAFFLGYAAVQRPVRLLYSEDFDLGFWTAWLRGTTGDTTALEPLVDALSSSDGDVRLAATTALRSLGDGRATRPLIEALRDERADVRSMAAGALGGIGNDRAVDALVQTLDDAHQEEILSYRYHPVAIAATRALGKIGDARAVEPLIDRLVKQCIWLGNPLCEEVIEALKQIGVPAVDPLLLAIENRGDLARPTMVRALGEMGEPAIEPLLGLLGNEDYLSLEPSLVRALGRIGEPAVEALRQLLRGENLHLRRQAARALGEIGEPAIESLIEALKAQTVRKLLLEELTSIEAFSGWESRKEIVKALENIGEPAIKPLASALDGGLKVLEAATAFEGRVAEQLQDKKMICKLASLARKLEAYQALNLIAARMARLDVEESSADDPLAPRSTQRRPGIGIMGPTTHETT